MQDAKVHLSNTPTIDDTCTVTNTMNLDMIHTDDTPPYDHEEDYPVCTSNRANQPSLAFHHGMVMQDVCYKVYKLQLYYFVGLIILLLILTID